jgi:hypothetical protein
MPPYGGYGESQESSYNYHVAYKAPGSRCANIAGLVTLCAWAGILIEMMILLTVYGGSTIEAKGVIFLLMSAAGAGLAGALLYFVRAGGRQVDLLLLWLGIPLLVLPFLQMIVMSGEAMTAFYSWQYWVTLAAATIMLGAVHASISYSHASMPRRMGGIAAIVLLGFQVYFLIDLIRVISTISSSPFSQLLPPSFSMMMVIGFFFLGGSIATGVLSLINMLRPPGDNTFAKAAIGAGTAVGYITPAMTMISFMWILSDLGMPGEAWAISVPMVACYMAAFFAPVWLVVAGISARFDTVLGGREESTGVSGDFEEGEHIVVGRREPPAAQAAPPPPPREKAPEMSYEMRELENQLRYGLISQEEYERRKRKLSGSQ